jgi:hypothetical protein
MYVGKKESLLEVKTTHGVKTVARAKKEAFGVSVVGGAVTTAHKKYV